MDRNEVTDVRRPRGTSANIRSLAFSFVLYFCKTCKEGCHFLFDLVANSVSQSVVEGVFTRERHVRLTEVPYFTDAVNGGSCRWSFHAKRFSSSCHKASQRSTTQHNVIYVT